MAGFLILLQSCMTAPQSASLASLQTNIPRAYEIEQVPFFPQEDYYCGPTTLAEVLNYYGSPVTPEALAPGMFTPDLEGSLQIEMVSSARQHALLAYTEQGTLLQLFSLVSDDIPVIVLQNLGTGWFPYWHYALVTGYDLDQDQVILHSGVTERRISSIALFENSWRKGDYWLLAAVPPSKQSDFFSALRYSRAAQDLIAVGQEQSGVKALTGATRQWPDDWLAYFLLGNHYLETDPSLSLHWFEQGKTAGSSEAVYLNNYAFALTYNGRYPEALETIQAALALDPENNRYRQSLLEIQSASGL